VHLKGISALFPTGQISLRKSHFVSRKLGFALLDLPLLCKPFKRVHRVKSPALEKSNAF